MTRRRDPVEHRRDQINRELSKLQNPKHIKKRNNFASDSNFEKWQETYKQKLQELYDELNVLDYPEEYFEVPLALGAAELGITLNEIHELVDECVIPISLSGISSSAVRINRDDLGKAIDIGAEELLRRARLEIPELFKAATEALIGRDVDRARTFYDRIEKRDSCINPYALACEIGMQFVSGDVTELEASIQFVLHRDFTDPLPTIFVTREMLASLQSDSHILEALRERFLVIADGQKETPFQDTFSLYQSTRFQSQLSDEQNLAVLIGDVVLDAVKKYKFVKSIKSPRSYLPEDREGEILRVIQNAAYTALEAHKRYNESATSKIFVDTYIGVKTKRRHAPQLLELLPSAVDK